MTFTLELKHSKFSAPVARTKKSAVGKRITTGGIEYDLEAIPANVLEALLTDAVEAFLQEGVKKLDKDNCTLEQCQAAMKSRLALLEAGAMSAPGQPRKTASRDPVLASAKAIVKTAFKERAPNLDARQLTKAVSDMFKQHKEWAKTKDEATKAALAPIANIVEDALTMAREQADKQKDMAAILGALGKAAIAKKAATTSEPDAPAAPRKKPSPTQVVEAQRAASTGKKGRAT